MTRIDAHQHFWRFDPVRDAWITSDMARIRRDFLPPDLEPELRASGMDGCIAVQADQSEGETRFLLDLAHRHEFVRGVVGWVDLRSPDLDSSLDRLSEDPLLRGVRHIAQAEADDFLARGEVIDGIGRLRDVGLTFDVLVYERQLPAAIRLAERLPDQPLVLDHLGKPRIREGVLEPWSTHLRELGRHGNVWCKVSGMVTEADWESWRYTDLRPYLEVAFESFGSHRIMFGSDWPVCLLAGSHGQVTAVLEEYVREMSANEQGAIFGGNAARFYGLEEEKET